MPRRPADVSSDDDGSALPVGRNWSILAVAVTLLLVAAVLAVRTDDDGTASTGDADVLGKTVERKDGLTTTEAEGEVHRVTVEGGAFFSHNEDPADNVAGSATQVTRDAGVRLELAGQAEGGRGQVAATVVNDSADTVRFPGGLTVRVTAQRDGAPWQTVLLADPAVTELAPGARATVSTHVELDAHGHYDLSGELVYRTG